MIYQLNGRVHFELEPDVMRMLTHLVVLDGIDPASKLGIGLCNFRSALQNELDRLEPPATPAPATPAPATPWD